MNITVLVLGLYLEEIKNLRWRYLLKKICPSTFSVKKTCKKQVNYDILQQSPRQCFQEQIRTTITQILALKRGEKAQVEWKVDLLQMQLISAILNYSIMAAACQTWESFREAGAKIVQVWEQKIAERWHVTRILESSSKYEKRCGNWKVARNDWSRGGKWLNLRN